MSSVMLRNKLFFLAIRTTNLIRFKSSFKIVYEMKTVYFRRSPQESQIQINFHYTNPAFKIDRDFNFCRSVVEEIDVFLDRVKNNLDKEMKKKQKSKKKNSEYDSSVKEPEKQSPNISVQILQQNVPVNNVTFEELLREQDIHTNLILRIIDEDFIITYNLPSVVNLSLPSSILAGFILYPCKLELQYADRDLSQGTWYKGQLPASKDIQQIKWDKVHEGLTYTTTVEDIDHLIKFELIPKNSKTSGPPANCVSKNEVQVGPGVCPFENRHLFTQNKLFDDMFRVTSYNILADMYADSEYTRKELFPYCPPYALQIDYRKQLFIKEILGYNSDILCLQEVDKKIFELDLEPILNIKGFCGVFQQKGTTGEGLATFYRKDRFESIEEFNINIGESISKLNIFKGVWEKINKNEKLVQRIVNRSTTLQVTLLKSKDTGNFLLTANTHLYFHPDADHVRLLQIGLSMIYLEDIYNKLIQSIESGKTLSLLFCGDFNSVPECGIFKLMTEKFVDKNAIDWQSNDDEAVKEVSLSQPFNLKSACGCPTYTNYTVGFFGCLDYIFYQTDHLEVKEVIPFPNDEEIKTHIAIPSVVFPSDHIALVADLKFI